MSTLTNNTTLIDTPDEKGGSGILDFWQQEDLDIWLTEDGDPWQID